MITNTKDGKTIYIMLRPEIKTFDINLIKDYDCIVIEHNMDEPRECDYFIHVQGSRTYVTKRYDLRPVDTGKQPDYIYNLIIDIKNSLTSRLEK